MSGLRRCCYGFPSRHCFATVHKTLISYRCYDSRIFLPTTASLLDSRLPISVSAPLKKRSFSAPAVDYPLPGVDDVLVGYLLGKKKATEVAHL
ncbi:unnamed protein product [Linum trigynum]|uniref:Uncharacterized protein n=1 Tax=Linum trigynum TaxID=586398 RepID=A0AAV2EZ60_9ROSI